MTRSLFAAALLLCALPLSAAADCADPPSPQVNWRRCYFDGQDLGSVKLSGAMLRDATFQRGTISGGDFSRSDGYRAKFLSVTGRETRFDQARLIEADFTRADLAGASFREADLRNARFFGAVLRKADFTGAKLSGTDFVNADLTGATWVDGARICADNSIGQCN